MFRIDDELQSTGRKVVPACYSVPALQQSITKIAAHKSRSARYKGPQLDIPYANTKNISPDVSLYSPPLKKVMKSQALTNNQQSSDSNARRSFALVFCCTLLAALAQLLVKRGTAALGVHVTLNQVIQNPALFIHFAISIVTNLQLFTGYALSGINVVLLTLALKGQELSRVYPIIALTFVWVTALSSFVLPGEHLNLYRIVGIASIVVGVSILGLRGDK
jgi:multidrug transporter EmrE-like cation transporter